ncbi:MAG: aspartate aminotransferase family protein [Spirochaetota bacterium]|nr:MAG: aspartate aminotransferase family protein [Spirochaetota bacterium]
MGVVDKTFSGGGREYLSEKHIKKMFLDFLQMKEFAKNPLVFEKGEGVWIWDVMGEKYLDGISGVWVVNVGHGNKRIIGAMKEQMDKLCFCSPIYSTNPKAIELVKMLTDLTPEDLNSVKLLSGGSEATETAMKLARQYHQQCGHPNKQKIISRYLNFHGVTLGALSATGMADRKWMFEPLCGGFRHILPPYCLRCPYKMAYPECDIVCARVLEDVIKYEGADTVAAFIAEPIQLSTGNIIPPPEYFPIIREICDRNEVLLIYDEIITGFGRTGELWGAQTFNAVPDILCVGKGMSSGYAPLSAVAFREKIGQAFWGDAKEGVHFAHGHTYAGNPVASAAGVAAISELLENNLIQRSKEMGSYLVGRLEELKRFGIVGEVRGKGLMIGVEFVKDEKTMESFPREKNVGVKIGENCMFKQKLLVRYNPNWIALAPPFIITKEEIDILVEKLATAIKETLEEIN